MKRISLFITLLFISAMSYGFETILVNQSYLNAEIGLFSDYLSTPNEDFTLYQITKPDIARQFSPVHGEFLKHNQITKTSWLTFALNNPTGKAVRMFLTIEAPFFAQADLFYEIKNNTDFRSVKTGVATAYRDRPHKIGSFVLPIDIKTGYQQVYLKVQPYEPTNMNIRLVDENTLLSEQKKVLQLTAFVTSLLLLTLFSSLFSYYRFQIKLALWSAVCILGFMINISGWTGSVAWWLTKLPLTEIAANNMGAFLIVFSMTRFLPLIRPESVESWLSNALPWLGYFFLVLSILSLTPFTAALIPAQIIILPVGLIILSIFWFEKAPSTYSERLTLIGFSCTLLYFIFTTLILVGLLSSFQFIALLSALAVLASVIFAWSSWVAAKIKGTRVAVEGFSLPDVHWPLLRKLNHEIRGPINGVLGMAELLQDTTLSAHQQDYVNTLQSAGFSLLREADQLQNLIRIGLNRLPDSDDEFDLYDLIEDTVQPFSRIAHAKHLELILDIAPELPARYRGNAHILRQILSNLLDNSLKYTEQGEVIVQVKPWQNQRIRFSISDTGPGFAKEFKTTMYNFPDPNNELQQLPKDVHLGLPITKYLVGLLGGQISLTSELRIGTTFWVDIPLTKVSSLTLNTTDVDALKIEELRIMVVDDNMTCRQVIEHLATNWGADVLSMSNGQSALANLHNQFHKGDPVDVVILDQNMPSMSGLELTQRIRQDEGLNKDMVIIMMTGADVVVTDLKEGESDIEFLLTKPVSARTLTKSLKSAMPKIIKNREIYNGKNSLFF